MAYASRTGTRRNLDALRRAGWRLLVVAGAVLRTEGFPYALDNGAWSCHQRGVPFDSDAFIDALELLGAGADWVALPDIVGGGSESLDLSMSWLDRVRAINSSILLPVQDGMVPGDIAPILKAKKVGIFLGGSTDWKLKTMRDWGQIASSLGCYFHVARVNSAKRIRLCQDARAHSFDGTSATRFAVTLPNLDNERRQGHLFNLLESR